MPRASVAHRHACEQLLIFAEGARGAGGGGEPPAAGPMASGPGGGRGRWRGAVRGAPGGGDDRIDEQGHAMRPIAVSDGWPSAVNIHGEKPERVPWGGSSTEGKSKEA